MVILTGYNVEVEVDEKAGEVVIHAKYKAGSRPSGSGKTITHATIGKPKAIEVEGVTYYVGASLYKYPPRE